MPKIRLPARATGNSRLMAVAVTVVLVGVRFAVRVIDTITIAFAFQLLVLAVVLARIAWREWKDARQGINPAV
jgi:hypothetical protein